MGPAVQVVRVEGPPGAQAPKSAGPRRLPTPAARLTTFWVFKERPDFDRDNRPDRFSLRFLGLGQVYASTLRIGRDPGIPLVYTGGLLLLTGIGVALATSHRRVWARVGQGRLALGGAA